MDPDAVVGSEEIGPNWCEVDVQVAIKKDEHLVRKYGLFITVQDAVGAPVAWPCYLVSVCYPVIHVITLPIIHTKVYYTVLNMSCLFVRGA